MSNTGQNEFAAVILSGGASSRMGSPKALLTLNGQTFIDRLVTLFQPQCAKVVVVLGYHADLIRNAMKSSPDRIVINPDPARGQLTSLQAGFASLDPVPAWTFFLPVDYPAVSAGSIQALISAAAPDCAAVVPRHAGKHGHPVLLSAPLVQEILALPDSDSARTVIHRHIGNTRYVDVPDAGVLRDIDYPAEYQALAQEVASV